MKKQQRISGVVFLLLFFLQGCSSSLGVVFKASVEEWKWRSLKNHIIEYEINISGEKRQVYMLLYDEVL